MTPPCPVKSFAQTLKALPASERRDSFANAVIEGGGHYNVPRDRPPDRSMVTVNLHGIQTSGWLEDAAIESWIRIALGENEVAA